MRRKIKDEYLNKAYLFRKDYDTDTYSDIPLLFRFANYNKEKSTYVGEELLGGWTSTDEGRKIVTNSSIKFQREDRVTINGSEYMVTEFFVSSDDNGYGAIRNRPNRDITMLVLS